jgi:hypothetical protein
LNNPDMWVRADGAFEAIVDRQLFDGAQRHHRRANLQDARSRNALGTQHPPQRTRTSLRTPH